MSRSYLVWTGAFQYPDMVLLSVPGDGSCFFHAILLGSSQEYRLERQGDNFISRQEMVRQLRQELSRLLATPLDPLNPESRTHYDLLGRQEFATQANSFPQLSLESMQKTLASNSSIDYTYFEFVARALDKDLYFLDLNRQDVLVTGDEDLYQQGRPSLVLAYRHHHYELVGLQGENGVVRTLFQPEDNFIQVIRNRQVELKRKST